MLLIILSLQNCFTCEFSQDQESLNTVINLNQICGSNSTTQIQVLHDNVPVFNESFQQQNITIKTPLQDNLVIIASLDGIQYEFYLKNKLNIVLLIVSISVVFIMIIAAVIVIKMIQKYKRKQNSKKQATPANSILIITADESSVCTGKRIDSVMDQQY
ncbi:Hypothetical_protein [Hexamita inflata]|uniref:Hypothetical_protein n=1 Tax=Hexamita inflata TaxID=28002 RepID=A0AA86QF88_9EUKA|nr:Hypothetical protein HINF_LOCUS43376 [Hexamita inflata]